MTHDPYLRKRRIVEETFGPPPDLGDVDDLNAADDEFDDDDDDERDHLGDAADGSRGPGPR